MCKSGQICCMAVEELERTHHYSRQGYSLFFLNLAPELSQTDDNNIEQQQNPGTRLRTTDCSYNGWSTPSTL